MEITIQLVDDRIPRVDINRGLSYLKTNNNGKVRFKRLLTPVVAVFVLFNTIIGSCALFILLTKALVPQSIILSCFTAIW